MPGGAVFLAIAVSIKKPAEAGRLLSEVNSVVSKQNIIVCSSRG